MPLSSSMISLVCRLCIKINLSIQLLLPLRSISCSNGQHRQEFRVSTSSSIVRFKVVHDLCARLGCNVEYSCPGQLGQYQNGLFERRIKEIGRIARCGKEMSGVPDLASSYSVLHAVDILNALPTKANPTDGTTDVTGFSPYLKYYGSQPSMD